MTDDCVFCGIVAGEVEVSVAYEDEATLAFMDLSQFAQGHTLVVPKRHVRDIFELDDETGAAVMAATARVARGVDAAFSPHGVTIWQSNRAPWQEVFHLHVHVLPRWREDGLMRFTPPSRDRPPRAELDRQAAAIREALAGR
ncbi:MAG: HIT family protein [Dehalococcoidia bacterium]